MKRWRVVVGRALAVLLGLPLLQPFPRLGQPIAWAWSVDDLERIGRLAVNTLLLVSGTCLLALPAGTLLALLLFRTEFAGRRWFVALLVLCLFIPLPIILSSWQGLLGSGGLLRIGLWLNGEDRPWATGWGPAIWVHAIAAVPWVACIVGVGLRHVEPELEEAAALQLPPWRVMLQVTLPRCRASIGAALLFVSLQAAGEISVTDMMLISTFAEEVYTQFTLADDALGRTLLLALPLLTGLVGVLAVAVARLEQVLPPLPFVPRGPRPLVRRPAWALQWLALVAFAALLVPGAGLI